MGDTCILKGKEQCILQRLLEKIMQDVSRNWGQYLSLPLETLVIAFFVVMTTKQCEYHKNVKLVKCKIISDPLVSVLFNL